MSLWAGWGKERINIFVDREKGLRWNERGSWKMRTWHEKQDSRVWTHFDRLHRINQDAVKVPWTVLETPRKVLVSVPKNRDNEGRFGEIVGWNLAPLGGMVPMCSYLHRFLRGFETDWNTVRSQDRGNLLHRKRGRQPVRDDLSRPGKSSKLDIILELFAEVLAIIDWRPDP